MDSHHSTSSHHKVNSASDFHDLRQIKKISESFDRAKATANNELSHDEAQVRKHLEILEREKAERSALKNYLKEQKRHEKEELKKHEEMSNIYQHDLEDMLQHCKYEESEKRDRDEHHNDAVNQLAFNRRQRRMTIHHLQEIREMDESGHHGTSQVGHLPSISSSRNSITATPHSGRRGSLVRPSLQVAIDERRTAELHAQNSRSKNDDGQHHGTGSPHRRTTYCNKNKLAREEKEDWLEHNNKFGHHRKNAKSAHPPYYAAVHPNPSPYQSRIKSILEYHDNGNMVRSDGSTSLHSENGGRRGSIDSDAFARTGGRRQSVNEKMISADFVANQKRVSLPHNVPLGHHVGVRRSSVDQNVVPLARASARKSIGSHENEDLKKLLASRRHHGFQPHSPGPSSSQHRRRGSLFVDENTEDLQKKSLEAYQHMLSEAHHVQPSDASTSDSHHPNKYDKIRDALRTLPSSQAVTIDPMEALQCRYLRLQPTTVDELEQLCVLMGEDPGVHAHMNEQDVVEYYA